MPLQRITADQIYPLFDTAATRRIEQAAQQALPPHTLMQRAGLATAKLALSAAPRVRLIWIACGPGNNRGNGLEAALYLRQAGKQVVVTWLGTPEQALADALTSFRRARDAGVTFSEHPPFNPGAGRVFVSLLDANAPTFDLHQPELMFRTLATLPFEAMPKFLTCFSLTVL